MVAVAGFAFPSDTFRTNIEFAMTMGLPNEVENRPTFRWLTSGEFTPGDPSQLPYDWTATPETSSPAQIDDFQVLCGVQYLGASEEGTVIGVEEAVQARITLLDTQYQQLMAWGGRWPDQVILAGSLFNVNYTTHQALFDVDVYEMFLVAEDMD